MAAILEGSLVSRWRGKRVFVLGDVMLDRFVYGRVERVSPEAPIPVLHFQREMLMLGGAANVVRNVMALGGDAILVGALGCDEDGDRIAGPLTEKDGFQSHFIRAANCPTISKTRFICSGQQIMRLDHEQTFALSEQENANICAYFQDVAPTVDVLVLSDYAKGLLSRDLVRRVIETARACTIPIVVDPKSRDVRHYAGASVITPNASEASMLTGFDCSTDDMAEKAAATLCALADVDSVVLTRGPLGMTIFDPRCGEGKPICIPTSAAEVFDVSGAGDTVVATLSLALAGGLDLVTSAQIANTAAAIVVGKSGTAVVRAQELSIALKRDAKRLDVKIVTVDDAAVLIEEWRERRLSVGFTNGCFDLLHPGHVELLRRARDACDRLIVALNSDASVRRLKGHTRPVQNEFARGVVMASLDSVDLVTFFDGDTPLELLERFRPDVLIKGADYTMASVVGADLVQSYGGKVMLVPLTEGHSTTAIIERRTVGAN